MLKGNLIIWNKQRWFIKIWISGKLKEFDFLNQEIEEFTVTLSPVEYLTVEYSTFKTFEKAIITVN